MTREEAIEVLENGGWWDSLIPVTTIEGRIEDDKLHEALDLAIAALRPVSREQVERVWRGEWIWDTSGLYPKPVCSKCGEEPYRRSNHTSDLPNYCPKCGAPMTDEAVEMVLERLEEMHADRDT